MRFAVCLLAPFGVRITEGPVTPARLVALLRARAPNQNPPTNRNPTNGAGS